MPGSQIWNTNRQKNETLRIILWRLTRRRETNWKMTRFTLTWNRKVERKAQLIRISIRFEMEERRMGSRWWWPFLSPSSLLYQHRCLTEFVPWLCVRKSVSLMSFRSSFVIHEIRPNFPLPSSLPSLPRRRTTVISFQLSPRVRPESRIHWITT